MSVSIDTVYQRVLSILNKEQRGYVTPQEFNLFANQAQMDIFEQYFYDLSQFNRLPTDGNVNADIPALIEEKISLFEKTGTAAFNGTYHQLPSDLYRLNNVFLRSYISQDIYDITEIELVSPQYFLQLNKSDLTAPSSKWPIYIQSGKKIEIFPQSISQSANLYYIKKPAKVEWKYQIVFGEALYDSTYSVDFELHESEETELVIKILELAGVLVKDLSIYQIANSEEQEAIQQEKA